MEALDWPQILKEIDAMQEQARAGIAIIPDSKFLASFIKLERTSVGWKQEALASLAGVSLSTIQRIERGEDVSSDSLDRIALALGQKKGVFTEPRVPLTREQFKAKLEETLKPWRHTISVDVRPLQNQSQAAKLVKAEVYLVDGDHLGEEHRNDIDELRDTLSCLSFNTACEDSGLTFESAKSDRLKRREVYKFILAEVAKINKAANSITLAGTYIAKTTTPLLPEVSVGVLSFFLRNSDPGAIKRRVLFAPQTIDIKKAVTTFLNQFGPNGS